MAQITLEIPDDLSAELEPMLLNRDISLSQVVSLYLRSMVNSVLRGKSLTLTDKMPFGKYKGENVGIIAKA